MVTASVIVSLLPRWRVERPPGMLNRMTLAPGVLLAWLTAERRVPGSRVSAVLVTTMGL